MNLNDVRVFLMVSTTTSLAQAAKRLEISAMAVSRRLASLEEELGIRLLHRTTRSVSLTPEGEEFLPYARSMLEAEEGAKSLFAPDMHGASGLLRVTAPSGIGRRNVLPLVPELLRKNPQLRIDVNLHEDVIDIVGRGIDVAIRVAPLRDSNLIAKKIIDNPRVVCAAPDYLKQNGTPTHLHDLSEHSCIRLSNVLQWTFIADGQPTSISVEGRFSCSNVEGVRELCVAGVGLAQLTRADICHELRDGSLVVVDFLDAQPQELSIWAVLPTTKHLPNRVSVFIDALKEAMANS